MMKCWFCGKEIEDKKGHYIKAEKIWLCDEHFKHYSVTFDREVI